MKQEKGITLVALVIMVIITIIIAGVAISGGVENIDHNKIIAFVNELKMVQAEVNIIAEKISLGYTEYDNQGMALTAIDQTLFGEITRGPLKEKTAEQLVKFHYFSIEALQELGIQAVKQEVLINWETREVFSVKGIKVNDEKIGYQLTDFAYEGYNVY